MEINRNGLRASGIVADVGDLTDVQHLAAHAIQTFGRIDVWVNNAGTAGAYGPTAALEPAIVERGIRTNILGVYYGSVVAIQHFQEQGTGGKLINMLGRGDHKPVPLQNAYAPTKAWVRSFTSALAREYSGMGIGVYMLNPGLMDTDLMRKITVVRGFEQKVQPLSVVMRLWANPPTVPAEMAVWLASPATDGKTGLERHVLTMPRIASGLLRDGIRLLRRQPVAAVPLEIHSVEPYNAMKSKPPEAQIQLSAPHSPA